MLLLLPVSSFMSRTKPKKDSRQLKTLRYDPAFLRALKAHARAERKSMSRILEDAFWRYLPDLQKEEDQARERRRSNVRATTFSQPDLQLGGFDLAA